SSTRRKRKVRALDHTTSALPRSSTISTRLPCGANESNVATAASACAGILEKDHVALDFAGHQRFVFGDEHINLGAHAEFRQVNAGLDGEAGERADARSE